MRHTKLVCASLIIMLLCMCNVFAKDRSDFEKTVVIVAGEDTSRYSAGIAVGMPGEKTKDILTACSNILNRNGSVPKTVQVIFNAAANRTMTAQVVDYNTEKDLALLRLPEYTDDLIGAILYEEKDVDLNDTYTALGFGYTDNGAGDLIGNTVQFFNADIKNISRYKGMDVYNIDIPYSTGIIGGPLTAGDGIYGMVNYSKADDYCYSVTVDSVISFLRYNNVQYLLHGEQKIRLYIFWILIISALIVLLSLGIIIYLLAKNKVLPEDDKGKKDERVEKKVPAVRVIGGILSGKTFDVEERTLIGRDYKRCAIVYPLNESGISSVHCALVPDGEDIIIEDLHSKYGSFLKDGTIVDPSKPERLSSGDKFYLATEKNMFEIV